VLERFSDRARRVAVLAPEESRMLGHDRIGPAHLLLGVLRDRDGATVPALDRIGPAHPSRGSDLTCLR
jgi:ATP-dependent Clp protease ATP-binding subunit ClpC